MALPFEGTDFVFSQNTGPFFILILVETQARCILVRIDPVRDRSDLDRRLSQSIFFKADGYENRGMDQDPGSRSYEHQTCYVLHLWDALGFVHSVSQLILRLCLDLCLHTIARAALNVNFRIKNLPKFICPPQS